MKRRPLPIDGVPHYEPLAAQGRSVTVKLVTTTPIYGGGAVTRHIDPMTAVRPSSIRGQLRFWWRALFGASFEDSRTLWTRERQLWGGLDGDDSPSPSLVRVAIEQAQAPEPDTSNVGFGERAAYALWPARATNAATAAERVPVGHSFMLKVDVAPSVHVDRNWMETRAALRAWLLFGGVGGRTRRGCGSIGLEDPGQRAEWLPESLEPGVVHAWLTVQPGASRSFPVLHDADVRFGPPTGRGVDAWITAIGWLRDFRQGVRPGGIDTTPAGDYARQQPSLAQGNAGRPGRSRWPEPDYIRHLAGSRAFDHDPLIPPGPRSWPRAQFGLPIQVRFQKVGRDRLPFRSSPPRDTAILWTPDGGDALQRLASPVIVKPVQLRDGRFAPVALWLERTLPAGAHAGLAGRSGVDGRLSIQGAAPMSAFPSDPLFKPLVGKASTRQAFIDWLASARRLTGGKL